MNSKFNDKLFDLDTFFKGLKEDDVILLQNDKDTSYNASNLYHCFLHSKNIMIRESLIVCKSQLIQLSFGSENG